MAPPDPQTNKDVSAAAEPSTTVQHVPGCLPIPVNDYIRLYQQRSIDRSTDLWPVEFFVVPYRRIRTFNVDSTATTTQELLVRSSSNNGT